MNRGWLWAKPLLVAGLLAVFNVASGFAQAPTQINASNDTGTRAFKSASRIVPAQCIRMRRGATDSQFRLSSSLRKVRLSRNP